MDKLYKQIAKIGRQYGAAKVVLYGSRARDAYKFSANFAYVGSTIEYVLYPAVAYAFEESFMSCTVLILSNVVPAEKA